MRPGQDKKQKRRESHQKRASRKQEVLRQRFFRYNNPILRGADRIIDGLDGTNEERQGQLGILVKTEEFKARFPGFRGEDVAYIANAELGNY